MSKKSKKQLNESGIVKIASLLPVGSVIGLNTDRKPDNFKFKGFPGEFDKNGNKLVENELNEENEIYKVGDKVTVDHPRLSGKFTAKITGILQNKQKGIVAYSLGDHGVWDHKYCIKK